MVKTVSDAPTEHVFTLLDGAMRALRDAVRDADTSTAPAAVRRELETLRSSQLRLVSLVPEEGLRVTELAERAGMTKQALSEFARALQDKGLLEIAPDPTDGRARRLRPTPLGRAVAFHGQEAIRRVEAQWREAVGPAAWDAMRVGLRAVGAGPTPTHPDR